MFQFITALPNADQLNFKEFGIQLDGAGPFFDVNFQVTDGVIEIEGQIDCQDTQLSLSLRDAAIGKPKAARTGQIYTLNITAQNHCLVKLGTCTAFSKMVVSFETQEQMQDFAAHTLPVATFTWVDEGSATAAVGQLKSKLNDKLEAKKSATTVSVEVLESLTAANLQVYESKLGKKGYLLIDDINVSTKRFESLFSLCFFSLSLFGLTLGLFPMPSVFLGSK